MISPEFNFPFPNEFRAECLPLMASYGSLQDWDGLLLFAYDPEREALMLGIAGAVAGLLVSGTLDHYLFNLTYPHMTSLLWIFVGLGMVAVQFALAETLETAPAQLVHNQRSKINDQKRSYEAFL